MGTIIVGAVIFCYGLTGIRGDIVAAAISAVGLSIALRGVCELTANFVTRSSQQIKPASTDEN